VSSSVIAPASLRLDRLGHVSGDLSENHLSAICTIHGLASAW